MKKSKKKKAAKKAAAAVNEFDAALALMRSTQKGTPEHEEAKKRLAALFC